MTDHELLQQYVQHQSEEAFADLVQRHASMVYASAMRQLGNPHLAEEVTQAVFILLARKAPTLKPGVILGGWLFRAAQFAVNDLRKSEFRRQRRETLVYEMNNEEPSPLPPRESSPEWEQVAPVLDTCLHRLGETDRHAILLRYFENKSLAEVGASLGIAEDAARKRVRRALDKLQVLLKKHGTAVHGESLPPLLQGGRLAIAAPAGLLAGTVQAALQAVQPASISSTASGLAASVGQQIAWAQWKYWLSMGTALLMATGGAAWTWHTVASNASVSVAQAQDNYLPAGFPDAEAVHSFIQTLQSQMLQKDRAGVVAQVRYPLRVNSRSGSITIQTPAQLQASFDKVFTAQVVRALLKCPRSGLYCNEKGVMIGSGEIWLAPRKSSQGSTTETYGTVQPEIIAVNLP